MSGQSVTQADGRSTPVAPCTDHVVVNSSPSGSEVRLASTMSTCVRGSRSTPSSFGVGSVLRSSDGGRLVRVMRRVSLTHRLPGSQTCNVTSCTPSVIGQGDATPLTTRMLPFGTWIEHPDARSPSIELVQVYESGSSSRSQDAEASNRTVLPEGRTTSSSGSSQETKGG